MRAETKKQNKKQAASVNEKTISINGIGLFCEHPKLENCWIYNGSMPTSNCWIFVNGKNVEIHNVIVYNPDSRFSGYGKAMISDIRKAFPESHIWVDTWNCTRPFWQKMQHGALRSFAENILLPIGRLPWKIILNCPLCCLESFPRSSPSSSPSWASSSSTAPPTSSATTRPSRKASRRLPISPLRSGWRRARR